MAPIAPALETTSWNPDSIQASSRERGSST
jgi:hypothetical protein